MSEDRDERTIKEIIEYLKIQNGNCSNELSNVEGLCLVNYIEYLEKENTILKQTMCNNSLLINENALLKSIIKEVREYIKEMPNDEYIGYWKKEIFEILDKENI